MRWVERISPVVGTIAVMVFSSAIARIAVGGADAEVVHASGAADADFATVVDVVVAESVVAGVG